VLDVTDEPAVVQAYAEVEARYGRLDILANNAGIPDPRASRCPLDRLFEIMHNASCMHPALPQFLGYRLL
jgi:NAD(P)-dependent dehydrogenase (short-subunit alcohol dehydrogenase family)